MKQIILASSSPRRKELLEKIGLQFIVEPSNYEEFIDTALDPHLLTQKLAKGKTKKIAKKNTNAIVIGADTLVVINGKYLGKPKDTTHAKIMLKLLNGKQHNVITAFCVMDTETKKTLTTSVETKVWIKKLSEQEINSYIATGDSLGKAGAYAIQELGMLLVERIEGDFNTIVGLPVFALVQALKGFGINLLVDNMQKVMENRWNEH